MCIVLIVFLGVMFINVSDYVFSRKDNGLVEGGECYYESCYFIFVYRLMFVRFDFF